VLPPDASVRWRSVLSGREVVSSQQARGQSFRGPSLKIMDLFEDFPVAFFGAFD
jgi:hypothetical protein